jgi:hypothetical protein
VKCNNQPTLPLLLSSKFEPVFIDKSFATLVLFIYWRVWITPIAVFTSNLPILAMYDDLTTLTLRCLNCRFDRLPLGPRDLSGPRVAIGFVLPGAVWPWRYPLYLWFCHNYPSVNISYFHYKSGNSMPLHSNTELLRFFATIV